MNTYGKCPQCGTDSISRERRPNGNDKCANGHTYPSANAIQSHSGGEAVAELILDPEFLPALKVPLVDWKINMMKLEVGTKLFTYQPDQSARIKEQQAERDMIFGLLKQLRVAMFNMCNEEQSDLEWIYNTNQLMKDIDFMFLHGYLQDSKTVLTELQAHINHLREALKMFVKDCTGEVIHSTNWLKQVGTKALSATAERSLIEHDNETIERCAKHLEERMYTTVSADLVRKLKA